MLIVHRAEVRGFRTSDPYPSPVSPAPQGAPLFSIRGKFSGQKSRKKFRRPKC